MYIIPINKLHFLCSVRNLDSLVYVLSHLKKNPPLLNTLSTCSDALGKVKDLIPQHAPASLGTSTVTLPPSGTKLSAAEIAEVRLQLQGYV